MGEYVLGLITVPILYGCYIVIVLMIGRVGRFECEICGYRTSERWILNKLDYAFHNLFIFPRKWHREGLRAWRIKVGRNPDTGKGEGK